MSCVSKETKKMVEIASPPKRRVIYYTGIGAGRRQFFTVNGFYKMIEESRDLQTILYRLSGDTFDNLDIDNILELIGASFVN